MLGKLFWSVSSLALDKPAEWRSSVADSFLPTFGDCPILSVFLRRQITTSERIVTEKYTLDLRGFNIAWDFYLARKYHLSFDDIQSFNDYLSILPRLPILCEHWVATRIMEIDLADPTQRALGI